MLNQMPSLKPGDGGENNVPLVVKESVGFEMLNIVCLFSGRMRVKKQQR